MEYLEVCLEDVSSVHRCVCYRLWQLSVQHIGCTGWIDRGVSLVEESEIIIESEKPNLPGHRTFTKTISQTPMSVAWIRNTTVSRDSNVLWLAIEEWSVFWCRGWDTYRGRSLPIGMTVVPLVQTIGVEVGTADTRTPKTMIDAVRPPTTPA